MVADLHNDLLLELVLRRDEQEPFRRRWLPPLRAGGVVLQVCALYAADSPPGEARAVARRQVEAFERLLAECPDEVFHVRSAEDVARVGRDGRIGLLLSLEGVEPVVDGFEEWWETGVRMVGLTWNAPNWAAGGLDAPATGLTDAGRELVDELAARGGILDLAHAAPRTFDEVLERAPRVVCSHAACRALEDVPRNLSDAQLRALAARGGLLGLMALGLAVGRERATVAGLVDHVEHAIGVMGVEHVALGTDVIDQVTAAQQELGVEPVAVVAEALARGGGRLGLEGFTGPEHFGALVAELEARGLAGEGLAAVTHGNVLRVLAAALPARVRRGARSSARSRA